MVHLNSPFTSSRTWQILNLRLMGFLTWWNFIIGCKVQFNFYTILNDGSNWIKRIILLFNIVEYNFGFRFGLCKMLFLLHHRPVVIGFWRTSLNYRRESIFFFTIFRHDNHSFDFLVFERIILNLGSNTHYITLSQNVWVFHIFFSRFKIATQGQLGWMEGIHPWRFYLVHDWAIRAFI